MYPIYTINQETNKTFLFIYRGCAQVFFPRFGILGNFMEANYGAANLRHRASDNLAPSTVAGRVDERQ